MSLSYMSRVTSISFQKKMAAGIPSRRVVIIYQEIQKTESVHIIDRYDKGIIIRNLRNYIEMRRSEPLVTSLAIIYESIS